MARANHISAARQWLPRTALRDCCSIQLMRAFCPLHARDMIDEAVENREQKAKQRQKEYERKREAKSAQRQLYHLRHTLDYEALGVPIGTSKARSHSCHLISSTSQNLTGSATRSTARRWAC